MEMDAEMGLSRTGEDDNEDDDVNEGDATEDTAATTPPVAAPVVAAKGEEDPEMLILEQESPEAFEIILPDEEPELLQPSHFAILMTDHEESPLWANDDLDDLTLDDYGEEEWYPNAYDRSLSLKFGIRIGH
jgi:hypothetical protein